jgi:hypothetical protein
VDNEADSPEGVFGNLPSTRPGSRSPRRRNTDAQDASAGDAPEAAEPVAPPEPEPQAPAPAEPEAEPGYEPDPPQPVDDPLAPQPSIQGVEDLAWAGVAVVAQAATAGIRFTSRALEAARKSIDRP